MKNKLILIFLLILLVLPISALAALPTTLGQLGSALIGGLWTIFTVIAVCCFMIAGILFLTARGNPQSLSNARSALIWGVAGAAVGIISASILPIITSWLSGF